MEVLSIPLEKIKINKRLRELNPEKMQELIESIKNSGLINPLTVYRVNGNYELLAGLHRYEACKELGWQEIPCIVVEEENTLKKELLEIDENLIRVELTVLERAELLVKRKEIYEKLYPESTKKEKVKKNLKQFKDKAITENETVSFSVDTARKTGLSQRIIQMNVKIAHQITPETKEIIKTTPLANSTRELLKITRVEPEKQKKVVEKMISSEAKTVEQALKKLELEEIQKQKVEVPQFCGEFELNRIYKADIKEIYLPDNSIDLIFTDPPYHDEYLELYEQLAVLAKKCLKPGSYCLAYCGKMYLPEIINTMSKHLQYIWIFAISFPGSRLKVQKYHFFDCWRPVLVFKKEGENRNVGHEWTPDIASGQRDKSLHEWQQSIEPVIQYLKAFSRQGDIVLDPFVGSGTTAVACLQLKRNFIAFDKDENAVKISNRRVEDYLIESQRL